MAGKLRAKTSGAALLSLVACADTRDDAMASSHGGTWGESSSTAPSDDAHADEGGEKLDVDDGAADATAGDSNGMPSCKVEGDLDGMPGDCEDEAPPDSFSPEVQWSWVSSGGHDMVLATPLVANLTDDNGDGAIDLCDTPDVIVTAMRSIGTADTPSADPAYIYVLDGATGQEHFMIQTAFVKEAQPAVGDVDGDGLVEIVGVIDGDNTVGIFANDGTLKKKSIPAPGFLYSQAIALYDLEADGDVEILVGGLVYDHEATYVWPTTAGSSNEGSGPVAVDLDDDGKLEIVHGNSAFRHDGELYWINNDIGDGGSAWADGYPHVANFDDDDDPEILVTNEKGLSILEHDGTPKYAMMRPTGESDVALNWARPAAVHDFDGDGVSDFAHGASEHFTVYRRDVSVLWTQSIVDMSGAAAGTAFDFLGDGKAEAMYADEHTFYAFDGANGEVLLTEPRFSRTLVEFPVVADIDNDGSAEVLVVSNETFEHELPDAPVKAIRDAEDRWIPARRIWNQHQYHVTNVREDGTIPTVQQKHWLQLNTFRTQAQVGEGGVCKPPVEG
ncbi:MAG TPA: VCBS repeat-containing protein [Nannocystaceae bacterium]|nr:VCBS repeat-containing protein [Nannocystaceae bacterium]